MSHSKGRSLLLRSHQVLLYLFWGTGVVFAQTEEEPVRPALPAEAVVRAADPRTEPVRRAEKHEKPRTDTGAGIVPGQPVKVKIETPQEEQVMSWETVDVFFRLQNYAIGEGGNRICLILDNGSPIEHAHDLKPIILRGLSPGAHTLRAMAVRPDGKMLRDTEAWDRINFHVRRRDFSNFQPGDRPYLTLNLPWDGLAYPDAEGKVWLDFASIMPPWARINTGFASNSTGSAPSWKRRSLTPSSVWPRDGIV